MTKRHTVYRDASTGRYVTKAYANQWPAETVGERVGPVRAAAAAVKARYTKGRRTN